MVSTRLRGHKCQIVNLRHITANKIWLSTTRCLAGDLLQGFWTLSFTVLWFARILFLLVTDVNITNDFTDMNWYNAAGLNAADPYSGRRLLCCSATLGENCRQLHLLWRTIFVLILWKKSLNATSILSEKWFILPAVWRQAVPLISFTKEN